MVVVEEHKQRMVLADRVLHTFSRVVLESIPAVAVVAAAVGAAAAAEQALLCLVGLIKTLVIPELPGLLVLAGMAAAAPLIGQHLTLLLVQAVAAVQVMLRNLYLLRKH